jgi:hypothetical protein
MEDWLGIKLRSLWVGKSPLRIAGNLLLLWLLLMATVVVLIFPAFPLTESAWLLLAIAGPPVLFAFWAGDEWVRKKHPRFRLLALVLFVVIWIVISLWIIIPSIPTDG